MCSFCDWSEQKIHFEKHSQFAHFLVFLFSMKQAVMSHSESRVVPFSRQVFFDVIADVERYQQFLPWCTRSRVLHRLGPLRFDAELAVGFRLYNESYVSRVTLDPPKRVKVASLVMIFFFFSLFF